MESENIFFKGNEKYLEKENIVFGSEEKSQERKGGNYLEKENLFFCGGEEKQIWKGGKIWRRKMFFEDCTEMLLSQHFVRFFWCFFILNFNYMPSETDFTQEKSHFHPAS